MKRMGYKAALRWIMLNDDTDWLDHENGTTISVTACFVANIYGVDEDKVVADLQKRKVRQFPA